MKALTVLQPYPHLIGLPATHPESKPIENRTWATSYRGLLAIHAGRGRGMLEPEDEATYGPMVFGAITCLTELLDCVPVEKLEPPYRDHVHAHGPYCWILGYRRPLKSPVPVRGAQGLWTPDTPTAAAVFAEVRAAAWGPGRGTAEDSLYPLALELLQREGTATVTRLQRKLWIDAGHAIGLMRALEAQGVGERHASRPAELVCVGRLVGGGQ